MPSRDYPEIWFVRHGETDWNRDRRIQGQTDIKLNQTGHAQARAIARTMAELHDSLDGLAVHVSPLMRPRQTLAHILDAFGQQVPEVSIDERLKELNFGEAEGTTVLWVTREARVYPEVANDPLAGRRALYARARELSRLPLSVYARSKASMRGGIIATIRESAAEDLDKLLAVTGLPAG